MNAKSRMAIFAACTTACHLAIAEPIAQTVETLPPGQWTAEQFRDAKPLEAPAVYETLSGELAERTLAHSQSLSTIMFQGSAPTIAVEPDNDNKLFDYVESAAMRAEYPVQPQDKGKAGAYFTSSRVTPAPAAQNSYPYRATGILYFKDTNGKSSICNATVIGLRLILTAGQCAYDAVKKSFYSGFVFFPAYHKGSAPYGLWEGQWVMVTKLWAEGQGKLPNTGDFAIIEMKDNAKRQKIGEIVGGYGGRMYPETQNANLTTVIGYYPGFDKGEWMHRVDSNVVSTKVKGIVLYGSDMGAFSQGAALIEDFGERADGQSQAAGGNMVLAVTSFHTYEQNKDGSFSQAGMQGATLLNNEFLSLYKHACAHREGNCRN